MDVSNDPYDISEIEDRRLPTLEKDITLFTVSQLVRLPLKTRFFPPTPTFEFVHGIEDFDEED